MSQVTIADDAPGNPQALILTGVGTGPAINLSSSTLSFGNQLVSTTSAAQTVILASSGEIGLTISSIVASGDNSQTNNCVSPVAAGASCAICPLTMRGKGATV